VSFLPFRGDISSRLNWTSDYSSAHQAIRAIFIPILVFLNSSFRMRLQHVISVKSKRLRVFGVEKYVVVFSVPSFRRIDCLSITPSNFILETISAKYLV
jgi:hypothetical protein